MTTHEWHERDEGEEEPTYYRAKHHAGRWTFHLRHKDESDWEEAKPPSLELLESFREVLWNKVQRRRVPEKHLDQIDQLIADSID